MRILVAEDDYTSLLMLKGIMEKWRYTVVPAADGAEAWEILRREDAPQIAILDWEMPGHDGVELCRRIKEMERENPIYTILLTGRDSTDDIVRGLNAGADDYVTKPFDNNELLARINVAERMVNVQQSLNVKVAELKHALDHVKTLQGILPICMHCHKIRNDDEAWQRLENYITSHSEARFSHGICPDCLMQHYPEMAEEESEPVTRRKSLLIVDRDPVFIRVNKHQLEMLGYEVATCTDSPEALDLIRNNPDSYDLIIVDHSLADIDGTGLVDAVCKLNPATPVLACTDDPGLNMIGVAARVKGVVSKPVEDDELLQAIRSILG